MSLQTWETVRRAAEMRSEPVEKPLIYQAGLPRVAGVLLGAMHLPDSISTKVFQMALE